MNTKNGKNGIRVLNAPIQMTEYGMDTAADSSSIWLNGLRDNNGPGTVDSKKLQKAEDKIKQKQEKRQLDSVKPLPSLMKQECQASAAQVRDFQLQLFYLLQ